MIDNHAPSAGRTGPVVKGMFATRPRHGIGPVIPTHGHGTKEPT